MGVRQSVLSKVWTPNVYQLFIAVGPAAVTSHTNVIEPLAIIDTDVDLEYRRINQHKPVGEKPANPLFIANIESCKFSVPDHILRPLIEDYNRLGIPATKMVQYILDCVDKARYGIR